MPRHALLCWALLAGLPVTVLGPVEVETVIHSFNQENGYITIVKPKLVALVNETASTDFMHLIFTGITLSLQTSYGLKAAFEQADTLGKAAAIGGVGLIVAPVAAADQVTSALLALCHPRIRLPRSSRGRRGRGAGDAGGIRIVGVAEMGWWLGEGLE